MTQKSLGDQGLDQFHVALGSLLRERREKQGWTQAELSKAVMHTRAWLSYVERGERRLGVQELHGLCKVLDIDADSLLDEAHRRAQKAANTKKEGT